MADTYSISLQGMRNAQLGLERAARNLAGTYTQVPAGPAIGADTVELTSTAREDQVDFAQQAVLMMQARIDHKAATKVLTTQKDLDGYVLDLIA